MNKSHVTKLFPLGWCLLINYTANNEADNINYVKQQQQQKQHLQQKIEKKHVVNTTKTKHVYANRHSVNKCTCVGE